MVMQWMCKALTAADLSRTHKVYLELPFALQIVCHVSNARSRYVSTAHPDEILPWLQVYNWRVFPHVEWGRLLWNWRWTTTPRSTPSPPLTLYACDAMERTICVRAKWRGWDGELRTWVQKRGQPIECTVKTCYIATRKCSISTLIDWIRETKYDGRIKQTIDVST